MERKKNKKSQRGVSCSEFLDSIKELKKQNKQLEKKLKFIYNEKHLFEEKYSIMCIVYLMLDKKCELLRNEFANTSDGKAYEARLQNRIAEAKKIHEKY